MWVHALVEGGVRAVPDIGFSFFEPDGRLWPDWINSQPDLQAVSIFCGGCKIHAELRAHSETVEDIALFHRAVRPDVTFILGWDPRGGAIRRLPARGSTSSPRDLQRMAYGLAQRRRLLGRVRDSVARSARECFFLNCAENDRAYLPPVRGLEAA